MPNITYRCSKCKKLGPYDIPPNVVRKTEIQRACKYCGLFKRITIDPVGKNLEKIVYTFKGNQVKILEGYRDWKQKKIGKELKLDDFEMSLEDAINNILIDVQKVTEIMNQNAIQKNKQE